MKITGTFNNYDNTKTYSVTIGDPNDSDSKPISDYSDLSGTKNVCFSTTPVTLSTDMRDTFTNVYIRQATINLIANYDISGDVTANNYVDIPILIKESNTVIFEGYVVPLSFNQAFNQKWNEFSVTCNDNLSVLNYIKFPPLLEQHDLNYMKVSDIINLIMDEIDKTVSYSFDVNNPIFTTMVNPQIFIGDSEDDWMNCLEVLNELGKIYGFYIWIDGNTVKCQNLISNYLANTTPVAITADDMGGSNVDLSVSEAYSQIKLTCDISSMPSTLVDPFDEEFLEPLVDVRNEYIEEYKSIGYGVNAASRFYDYINGTIDYNENDQELYKHYVMSMNNSQLDFGSNAYNSQNRTGIEVMNWLKQHPGKGAFVRTGISEDLIKTYGVETDATYNNYLIIQTNGKWGTSSDEDYMDDQIRTNQPIFTFSGQADNFTPLDDASTNYLVISGKIALNRLQKKTGSKWDNDYEMTTNTIADCSDYGSWYTHVVSFGNSTYGYYQQKYPTGIYPTYTKLNIFDANKDYQYRMNEIGQSVELSNKTPLIACQLKIGDKYCVERLDLGDNGINVFEWHTQEEITQNNYIDYFTIGCITRRDEYILNTDLQIQDTISNITTNIDANGTGIPIKFTDLLTGQFEFKILGPCNMIWKDNYKIYHGWLWWRHTERIANDSILLLDQCENVLISDFKINIVSDNGGTNRKLDNDLVYLSYTNNDYIESKEYDTKLCTSLTTQEATTLGVDFALNRGTILNVNGTPFTGFTYNNHTNVKLEEARVYEQREIWGDKKKELTATFKLKNPELSYYPEHNTFNYLTGTYYTVSREIDLKYNTMTNKLREQ